MKTDAQVYAGAAAIGMLAGIRSMSAPAVISQVARRGKLAVHGSPVRFLSSKGAVATMTLMAVGEVIADKVPSIPGRTEVGPLAARAATGAFSGAVLCLAKKRSPWLGAMYGGMGAIGAAFAAYYLRQSAKKTLHVPDAVVAVAEDAMVATGGWLLASQLAE